MTHRRPLPAELVGVVFSRQHARSLGVPDHRLEAADLKRIGHGVFAPANAAPSELAHATALRFATDNLWLSHESAARHFGLYLPPWADKSLHVSSRPGSGRRRTAGVVAHVVRADPDEVHTISRVPDAPTTLTGRIASPRRTWLDLAASLNVEDLIVLGDQLVRVPFPEGDPLATLRDLHALCDAHPLAPGVKKVREALKFIRVGADSRPETKMRLAVVRAGLPEPELQISPDPRNKRAPRADMGYRRLKLALQYEGGHHRTQEQYSKDLERDRLWARYGWDHLRYDVSDLRTGFSRLLGELFQRGLRPLSQ